MNRPAILTLLLAQMLVQTLVLSGCAVPSARYPSLLPRATERRDDSEPVRTTTTAGPDATLDARLVELRAALADSSASFATAIARATPLTEAARGAAVGSDAWLSAQAALSALDGARGQTLGTLADVERLAIDRAQAGQPPYPALDATRDAGAAQADQQAAAIDALQKQLPQG